MGHSQTSKRVGKIASKKLRSTTSSSETKSLAGNALGNRPHKPRAKPKKK